MPQQLCVLQSQRCDAHGAHISHDIRAIMLSTDSHLQNDHIHLLRNEDMESQNGQELKVGGHVVIVLSQLPQSIVHLPELLRELILGQQLAIDADPFVGGQDVRGAEESRADALVTQQGFGQGAGGALRGDMKVSVSLPLKHI